MAGLPSDAGMQSGYPTKRRAKVSCE